MGTSLAPVFRREAANFCKRGLLHDDGRPNPYSLRLRHLGRVLALGPRRFRRDDHPLHRADARPLQRPGRRLCRLRHLSAVRPILRVPSFLRYACRARHLRALSGGILRCGQLREDSHTSHPGHHPRADDLALLPFSPQNGARRQPARRAGIRRAARAARERSY